MALLLLAHLHVRWGGTPADQLGDFTPFLRVKTRELREARRRRPTPGAEWAARAFLTPLYLAFFACAVLALHTVFTHMLHKRNVGLRALLWMQLAALVVSGFDDLTQVGSPFGSQESSRTGARLFCVAALLLTPLVLVWTVAAGRLAHAEVEKVVAVSARVQAVDCDGELWVLQRRASEGWSRIHHHDGDARKRGCQHDC